VYTVIGRDAISQYETDRRYTDFLHLRGQLVKNWPGCYVPALPPKKKLGNYNPHFVEARRVLLEEFLQRVAGIRYLYESDEF
jgi:sorting nexin-1/2